LLSVQLRSWDWNVPKDVWYGLKMGIDHTQQCQTTMDYNPDCSPDRSFYDM